ncbi:MAG: SGNH/GDSL hydrolase family protein [Stigonema ocellatum SAG 48.90 = DSM 106950]|nr:SGNH/GDSL hydrolase family protein [Stigonema ocellatum SAG 48.90 = DSM 106950]
MKLLKSWLAKILLILTGILAGLLLMETFAVATGILVQHASTQRDFFESIQYDSRLGHKAKPNLKDLKMVWKTAGVSDIIRTDSSGFRNLGRDYTKSNLYFIGDSFSWGEWVNEENTFPRLIESELKQPVINLGIPGYGFQQYEFLFQDWVAKYKPHTAVLCIFANDLTKGRTVFTSKSKFDLTKKAVQLPWYKKTFIYQIILGNNKKVDQGLSSNKRKQAKNGLFLFTDAGADKDYLTSGNAAVEIEAALSRIIDLTKEIRVHLVVFLIPSKESTYIKDYVDLFPQELEVLKNEEIGYQRLCELAKSQQVTCVDMTEIFRQNSDGEKLYFDMDTHWTLAGHKLAAKVMYPSIIQGSREISKDKEE